LAVVGLDFGSRVLVCQTKTGGLLTLAVDGRADQANIIHLWREYSCTAESGRRTTFS